MMEKRKIGAYVIAYSSSNTQTGGIEVQTSAQIVPGGHSASPRQGAWQRRSPTLRGSSTQLSPSLHSA
jgi:hypothetical protein